MTWDDPTDEQRALWAEWLAARPDHVRAVAERFDPWTMYRLASTGQRARFLGCDVGFVNCGEERTPDIDRRITLRIYVEHPTLGEITATQVAGVSIDDLHPWTNADEEIAGL